MLSLPTRIVRSAHLSSVTGCDVWLKLESELPTGSFKVRGALYALERACSQRSILEVVAASTDYHGAAVAYAAQQLDIAARIFVPSNANPLKCDTIRTLGAAVTLVGKTIEDARSAARAHARASRAFVLDDATNEDVPVGASAIASEVLDQLSGVRAVYIPVGDSALIRGVAAVLKSKQRDIEVIGVQAATAPAYYLSWRSNQLVTTETADTIADGLATTRPTADNVQAVRALVDEMMLVTDDAMSKAIQVLYAHDGVVAEPAAAAPAAALLERQHAANTIVVLVITGSNISPELRRTLLG